MARRQTIMVAGATGYIWGRHHPDELRVEDALDVWQVKEAEPYHLLRLRSEMKIPGDAWLQFEMRQWEDGADGAFRPQGPRGDSILICPLSGTRLDISQDDAGHCPPG